MTLRDFPFFAFLELRPRLEAGVVLPKTLLPLSMVAMVVLVVSARAETVVEEEELEDMVFFDDEVL